MTTPRLLSIMKLALGVGALYWVARGISLAEIWDAFAHAHPALLIGAIALFFLTPVLQGIRLKRLLDAQGIVLGRAESIRLAFAGNFMNFAVPVGSTTGDVYKAAYLSRRTVHPWQVSVTTFVDRGIGLATLLLTVTAIVLFAGPESPLAPLRLTLVLLSLGVCAGAAFLKFAPIELLRSSKASRLPMRDSFVRLAEAARGSIASPRVLALAIVDTLGIQIAATASFLLAALALGFQVGATEYGDFYAFFSAGEIVKAIPGPPQGLGTLEAAYGVFFASWAGPSQIVASALAIRLINLICSLPGAAFVAGSAELFHPFLRSRDAGRLVP